MRTGVNQHSVSRYETLRTGSLVYILQATCPLLSLGQHPNFISNVKALEGTRRGPGRGLHHDCTIQSSRSLSAAPPLTETLGDVVDLVDIRVPGKYRVPGQHFRVQTADGPDVNLEIKTLTSRLFN